MEVEGAEAGSCSAAAESEVEGCLKPMLSYATTLQSNGLLPLEGSAPSHREKEGERWS